MVFKGLLCHLHPLWLSPVLCEDPAFSWVFHLVPGSHPSPPLGCGAAGQMGPLYSPNVKSALHTDPFKLSTLNTLVPNNDVLWVYCR